MPMMGSANVLQDGLASIVPRVSDSYDLLTLLCDYQLITIFSSISFNTPSLFTYFPTLLCHSNPEGSNPEGSNPVTSAGTSDENSSHLY